MSGGAIALAARKEIDETRSMELRHVSTNAMLRGRPSGDERDPDRHAEWLRAVRRGEPDPLGHFISEVRGPVNVIRLPETPALADLAALGVARVSWATLLYREAMARFADQLASLQE
jgi:hypothetical protein